MFQIRKLKLSWGENDQFDQTMNSCCFRAFGLIFPYFCTFRHSHPSKKRKPYLLLEYLFCSISSSTEPSSDGKPPPGGNETTWERSQLSVGFSWDRRANGTVAETRGRRSSGRYTHPFLLTEHPREATTRSLIHNTAKTRKQGWKQLSSLEINPNLRFCSVIFNEKVQVVKTPKSPIFETFVKNPSLNGLSVKC